MENFMKVEGACALVRLPKGVQLIVSVYTHKDELFVPYSRGYVRIRQRCPEGRYWTDHPSLRVEELHGDRIVHSEYHQLGGPRYNPPAPLALAT